MLNGQHWLEIFPVSEFINWVEKQFVSPGGYFGNHQINFVVSDVIRLKAES
jgi:hypothetical protein